MKLFNRFLISLFSIVVLISLHCYAPDIGHLSMTFGQISFSAGLYIVFAFLIAFLFILSFFKKIFVFLTNLFQKDKTHEQLESIDNIATLIQLSGRDFFENIHKMNISRSFEIIKKSLLIKHNFDKVSEFSLTHNALIDIKILKAKLQKALEQEDLTNATDIAQEIIKNYSAYAYIAKEEILKTNLLAKENKIKFIFDPRKFRYNISPAFAEKYFFEIEKRHLDEIVGGEDKLTFLKKLAKKFDIISEPTNFLLSFIRKNDIRSIKDSEIIDLIKKSFEIHPDRKLAFDLVRLNKPNQFEIAQEITANIENDDPEKLLFWLIVSLKSGFFQKSNDILQKLKSKKEFSDGLKIFYELKQEQ